MGKLKRFMGGERWDYHAVQAQESMVTGARDVPGEIMLIRPYSESEGITASAGTVQSLHDEHDPGTFSTEAWFDEGKLKFYARAPDEDGADNVRRRVASNFPNSEVIPLEGPDPAFPDINEGDWLVGATVKRHHPRHNVDYIPIRHFEDGQGFKKDPWTEILESMLSDDQTRVVVQVTFESVPESWVDPGGYGHMGVNEVERVLRAPRDPGWIATLSAFAHGADEVPDLDPLPSDVAAADLVEETNRLAFATNIRILAISPRKKEAMNRAAGPAKMFNKFYNSKSEAGLKDSCVDGRLEKTARKRMKKHIRNMRHRKMTDDGSVFQVEELAGIIPLLPPGDITTPKIDWVHTRSGGEIPADAPKAARRDHQPGPLGDPNPVDDRPEGW